MWLKKHNKIKNLKKITKMIVKIHKTKERQMLLVVCDSDLIGKKFEEGGSQLDLTSNFYKGKEKSNQEISDLMRNSYMINIVGENSVKLAIKEEIIDSKSIRKISNIPYAQCVSGAI